jgi:hypothetical protein
MTMTTWKGFKTQEEAKEFFKKEGCPEEFLKAMDELNLVIEGKIPRDRKTIKGIIERFKSPGDEYLLCNLASEALVNHLLQLMED